MKKPFVTAAQLEDIAARYPTPFHLYDEQGIRENARRLKAAFSWNPGYREYFAVKATPTPAILKILQEEGCGCDCSSLTELMMAERIGCTGEHIMFSSNETPAEDYRLAAKLGATINLDDITHVDFLEKTIGYIPKKIGCRFNPGGTFSLGESREGFQVMDNPGDAKYGMTRAQITEAFRLLKAKGAEEFGIHAFLASNTLSNEYYPALARILFQLAVELQQETGMTFIHPYDDEQVIAGQGTIGLEILDQLPDLDAVIVPVGGGGLISGVAFAIKSLRPEVKVYGVQAEGAPSMYRSLHEHKYQTLKAASTFADGIQVKTPGELTYQLCEQYVDDVVTVSEDETAAAILSLMENQKLVAEGAGAVPVAAALFHKLPIEGKKVVCVISGGNIDVNILSRVITRGLVMSGRKANLTIALEDKPGQLQRVAEIVSRCGSNVVSVLHDGSDPNMPISSCFLKLTLETRDAAQIEQIRAELTKEGFQLVSERV